MAIEKLLGTERQTYVGVGASLWARYVMGTLWCLTEGLPIERYENGRQYLRTDYMEWFARCGIIPYVKNL